MRTGRLEAFSDGVIAIIVTILVLELDVPEAASLRALADLWPSFAGYALSFLYLVVHWGNHHNLFLAAPRMGSAVIWANHAYLFCLSMIPLATAWADESGFEPVPVAVYGGVLLAAALVHRVLERAVVAAAPDRAPVERALMQDWKGTISLVAYVVGIALCTVMPVAAMAVYLGIAAFWAIPDHRLRRAAEEEGLAAEQES